VDATGTVCGILCELIDLEPSSSRWTSSLPRAFHMKPSSSREVADDDDDNDDALLFLSTVSDATFRATRIHSARRKAAEPASQPV
jgi:hypothetical protein